MSTRGWAELREGLVEEANFARCDELARQWSRLHTAEEQDWFTMEFLQENFEPDDCSLCAGLGQLGADGPLGVRRPRVPEWAVGILCPACNGDGTDHSWEDAAQRRREESARKVEEIEALLAHYGARMMRPYEHWNEDERLMEFAESGH